MTGAAPADPADAGGQPLGAVVEPGARGRLFYLFGGTLPKVHHGWVLRDLMGAGWRRRMTLRIVWQAVPFCVIFALLPGPVNLRVTIVVGLLLAAVSMGLATSGYFRNRRLKAHGFEPVVPPEEDEDL